MRLRSSRRQSRRQASTSIEHYNFAQRHGGYPTPRTSTVPILSPGQQSLQKIWAATWGGYTPMIFLRDTRGRVFQAQTDQTDVVDQVVQRAAQSR